MARMGPIFRGTPRGRTVEAPPIAPESSSIGMPRSARVSGVSISDARIRSVLPCVQRSYGCRRRPGNGAPDRPQARDRRAEEGDHQSHDHPRHHLVAQPERLRQGSDPQEHEQRDDRNRGESAPRGASFLCSPLEELRQREQCEDESVVEVVSDRERSEEYQGTEEERQPGSGVDGHVSRRQPSAPEDPDDRTDRDGWKDHQELLGDESSLPSIRNDEVVDRDGKDPRAERVVLSLRRYASHLLNVAQGDYRVDRERGDAYARDHGWEALAE